MHMHRNRNPPLGLGTWLRSPSALHTGRGQHGMALVCPSSYFIIYVPSPSPGTYDIRYRYLPFAVRYCAAACIVQFLYMCIMLWAVGTSTV